jgi:hypothetical protein
VNPIERTVPRAGVGRWNPVRHRAGCIDFIPAHQGLGPGQVPVDGGDVPAPSGAAEGDIGVDDAHGTGRFEEKSGGAGSETELLKSMEDGRGEDLGGREDEVMVDVGVLWKDEAGPERIGWEIELPME